MAVTLVFRAHALLRMLQRNISVAEVRLAIAQGEVIEDYSSDTPYPSRLILGWANGRPIHVVSAYDRTTRTEIIITVYEPDQSQWDMTFRRRLP